MNARTAAVAGILMVTLAGGLILFIGLPRWYGSRPEASTASPPQSGPVAQQPAAAARKITATLFYVSDDGMTLVVSSTDAMVRIYGRPEGGASRINAAPLPTPATPGK